MPKGVRATTRQKIAGMRNLMKAQVSRIGLRGQGKGFRLPKLPKV